MWHEAGPKVGSMSKHDPQEVDLGLVQRTRTRGTGVEGTLVPHEQGSVLVADSVHRVPRDIISLL